MKTTYLAFILALLLIAQSCTTQGTVLSVEAALVVKSGDVKPAARAEFFLLDKNFETILQESNFTSELPDKLKDVFGKISPLKTFAFLANSTEKTANDSPLSSSRKDELKIPLLKAIEATKSHIAYQATTDFQGKAQFKGIKAGEYYLFGYTKVGESVAVWNLKTEVKSGQNSITLDQNNAVTSN